MKRSIMLLLSVTALIFTSCQKAEPPKPYGPLPSERQLKHYNYEQYAFVHFNMNTFTDMEWGTGAEDPDLFNPTDLDCDQWAKVCKDAGLKGIILTAKHHDGFCLWPTKTTKHSVKYSKWRDGKGDVVKELSEACKKYGLQFGVYLSPWDRNNAKYGTPEYIDIYREQLRELLTNYGDVFEVWFDGANGGSGYYGGANETRRVDRKTYYDWPNTYKIVRKLQPYACMFSDAGPDLRWVGNEKGYANKTNWCLLRRDEFYPGSPNYKELTSGQEDGTHWVPAEVDVSIRPGWYYHKSEDHKVKTLPQLLDIYYHSVGRNAFMLINFPVDRRGHIHENDVKAIMSLANQLKEDFKTDLAKGTKISASVDRGSGYGAENLIDGKKDTYWATPDDVTSGSITIEFKKPTIVNRFLVQEYIPLGQRVKEFTVEAMVDGKWHTIAEETTIGYKRILRFEPVEAEKIRFTVMKSKACPVISNIELYHAPAVMVEPQITRNRDGVVFIRSYDKTGEVYYTTNGADPVKKGKLYTEPFVLKEKGTVKAIIKDKTTGKYSPVASVTFDICPEKWTIRKGDKNSILAFDGNTGTSYIVTNDKLPVDLVIDLGETLIIKGFTYLPDQSKKSKGIIKDYELYVSRTGKIWGKPVSKGEFSNIKNNPVLQTIKFNPVKGRYIKLRAISTTDDKPIIGVAEFSVITE
ncbi:MAG: alpha-L-fucosidase [Chlorobi bacterium]|nr:alpha-L-fucosidase [Chlorobiota bacterium]